MKLAIKAELVYTFAPETQVVANIEASQSSDQTVISESLDVQPPIQLRSARRPGGPQHTRRILGRSGNSLSGGGREQSAQLLPTSGQQHLWSDLPNDVLRSCCPAACVPRTSSCDLRSVTSAEPATAGACDDNPRVDSPERRLVSGVSSAGMTAEQTFVDRAGVCRDFTHLGITLSRALGIPARAVSAYALHLAPPDFHAIFEVSLETTGDDRPNATCPD